MAELTISADDIQGAIEEYVSSFTSDTAKEEVGTVDRYRRWHRAR